MLNLWQLEEVIKLEFEAIIVVVKCVGWVVAVGVLNAIDMSTKLFLESSSHGLRSVEKTFVESTCLEFVLSCQFVCLVCNHETIDYKTFYQLNY